MMLQIEFSHGPQPISSCVAECDIRFFFHTNKYPNKFVSKKLRERIYEYICIKNLTRTNVGIDIRIEN